MNTVDVIVPVYRGRASLQACLESLLAHPQQTPFEIVLIDDASPEPEVKDYLASFAGRHERVTLLENATNLGFVATVNRGMALHPDRDLVLLNSDTEVANDWLDRLVRCMQSDPGAGSVTPFSNNATICSFPRFCEGRPLPAHWSLAEIDGPKLATKGDKFQGIADMAKAMSDPMMPKTELEESKLKVKLANAGFRGEAALAVYSGIRLASLVVAALVGAGIFLPQYGMSRETAVPLLIRVGLVTCLGFFLPSIMLWWLRSRRQLEIFLTLPDALDLMVVCVESGLGLDAGKP